MKIWIEDPEARKRRRQRKELRTILAVSFAMTVTGLVLWYTATH